MAPMYEKPVRLLIKDLVTQKGMKPGEILQRDEVFDWFHKNYPKIKEATIHAHLAKMSVNVPVRIHYNVNPTLTAKTIFSSGVTPGGRSLTSK